MTPALLPVQGRQRDGPRQGNPPPRWAPRPLLRGWRHTGRPPSPRQADPPAAGRARRLGLPNDLGRTRTPGGDAPATQGGLGRGPQAAPPGGERWRITARPPPLSPHSPPPIREPRGRRPSNPPKTGGTVPPPLGRTAAPGGGGGGAAGTASTPPAACSRRNRDGQANPRQRTRTPHGPRPGTHASTNLSGMGTTPSMARATPKTAALLPAQGRQR